MNQNTAHNQNQHDNRIDLIARTVSGHTVRLDKIDTRLDKIDTRIDKIDTRLDKITNVVLDHSKDIEWIKENMATKEDIRNITTNIDVLVGLAKKKDQELTFMGERVKRVEDDVKKMKPLVGLS